MKEHSVINENYAANDQPPPLQKTSSSKNVVALPEIKVPTKKFRMRSLLWVKPTGVAVSSTSSFLAQLFPTIIVNLAAMSSGMGYGFSAIALPQLKQEATTSSFSNDQTTSDSAKTFYQPFKIDDDEGSWIAGIFGLGAIFGGFAAAILGSRFGRRRCLLLLTIPDILGWVLIASAQNLPMILLGRFLQGFASAGYSPSIWVYVAEIAQPQHRGTLGAITLPAIATGTLLSYCLGAIIDWHFVAMIAAVIPLVLIPGLLMISNSPYWYLQRGEDKKALQVMEKFRASNANGLSELLAIADSLKSNDLSTPHIIVTGDEKPKKPKTKMEIIKEALEKLFGQRKHRRPFLLLNTLFLIMRCSGSYVIAFYAVEIFRKTDPHDDENGSRGYLSAIGVGAIKLIGSLLFIPAIKYCSRRFLICISATIMSLSLAVMGLAMYAHETDLLPYQMPSWIPLACVTMYMAVDPLGLSSVPFIYMAEFYSSEMRTILSGITIGLSNLELFVIVKTFPMLSGKYGDGAVFWFYSGCCLAAVVFTLVFVPETKGKSLEEIEAYFSYKRKLNVTPFPTPFPTPFSTPALQRRTGGPRTGPHPKGSGLSAYHQFTL